MARPPHSGKPLYAVVAAVLLAASLAPWACAPLVNSSDNAVWPMSRDAETTYTYLAYLDLRRQGKLEEAGKAIHRLLELDPAADVYLEMAEFQWSRGRIDESREYLKQGLERYPEDKRLVLRLADTYMARKRMDDAALTIRLYLERHPDDLDARIKLAQILLEQKRHAEALDILAPVDRKNENPGVLHLKAKANAELGLNRKAIALLQKALDLDPDFILGWAELAYLYELEKDYVSAEQTYSRILEMGETGREVWLRLINLNLKLNNPDKGLALVQEGPQDTDFLLEATRMFISEGFHDQARIILSPLTQEEPLSPEVRFYQALLAFEGDNDPQQALEYLRDVPSDSPYADTSLSFRAHLLFVLERYDEAMEAVRQGRALYPNDRDFPEIESWIHEARGDLATAQEVLETALSKWPDDTEMLYRLGVLLEKRGQRDQALATMERVIAREPDNPDALNFVGYVLAEEGRDLDRALVLIQQALEQKPESGYIVDSLAWVHFKRGEIPKAWTEIRRAVSMGMDDPAVWEHYGDIARALGKKAEARKGYDRALEAGHEDPGAIRSKLESL